MRRSHDERGGATVFAVACLAVMLLVGAALGVVAAMVAAHRTAQSAADLAALSGAAELGRGRDPCRAAAETAAANG
ncbi:MAG: flp pilus-assembly TadE/G-like family protein, partial [Nocardioides sp.]|nr:flp pilus-assembly TadE/G-like family protein [Nocardioides sp.]